MYRISFITKRIAYYLISAAVSGVLCAAAWYASEQSKNAVEWLQLLSFAFLFVAMALGAAFLLEAYHLLTVYRQEGERHKAEMLVRYDPEIVAMKEKKALFAILSAHAELAMKLKRSDKEFLLAQDMIYHYSINMGKPDNKYDYPMARNVIYGLSEEQYREVLLPAYKRYPDGTIMYNLIRAVTDDLLAKGAAYRNHPTDRARLVVTREEAMATLFPEGDK